MRRQRARPSRSCMLGVIVPGGVGERVGAGFVAVGRIPIVEMHRLVLGEPFVLLRAEVGIGFILGEACILIGGVGEACVGEGGVGEIRIRVVRIGEALPGEVRLRVRLPREDAIGETGLLEGSVRLRLVDRRRLDALRHRSLTARLDRGLRLVALPRIGLAWMGLRPGLRLRLVALRLRLARISLRREGIWEIRGGVVSRRGAWRLVGWRCAILVGIA